MFCKSFANWHHSVACQLYMPHSAQRLFLVACLFVRTACIGHSDWHLGYPDCGGESQSPIDLAADVETVVDVSYIFAFWIPVRACFTFSKSNSSQVLGKNMQVRIYMVLQPRAYR